jgi:hypothetical protein
MTTIGEAQAVNDLLHYLFGGTDSVPSDRARAAAETLAHRARAVLNAGITADQVVEWWPDNAVAVVEDWYADLGDDVDEDRSLTEAIMFLRAIQSAPLNAAGREALG